MTRGEERRGEESEASRVNSPNELLFLLCRELLSVPLVDPQLFQSPNHDLVEPLTPDDPLPKSLVGLAPFMVHARLDSCGKEIISGTNGVDITG